MLEHGWAGTGRGALGVVHYRVALVAIPANDPAVAAHMLAVVATEAAIEIIMAEIIRMSLPVQFHLGEGGVLKNLLEFSDGVTDFQLLGFSDAGIFAFVEIVDALCDPLQCSIGGRIATG